MINIGNTWSIQVNIDTTSPDVIKIFFNLNIIFYLCLTISRTRIVNITIMCVAMLKCLFIGGHV